MWGVGAQEGWASITRAQPGGCHRCNCSNQLTYCSCRRCSCCFCCVQPAYPLLPLLLLLLL